MLTVGSRLGPYEILSLVGSGGMGEVYRARDIRLDRTVAIKVLNSSLTATPELKARFEREARAISQLNHPNICTLYDVGQDHGTDFLVMEFIDGESLAQRLRRGAVTADQLLRIAIEVADALDKAHRAGIAHRDLKPGNVMLTKAGAKLLDFGLAKPIATAAAATAAGSGSQSVLTVAMTQSSPASPASPISSAGSVVGTVAYMSPEQIQGLEADDRSDIFSFGVMLFEMATGKPAFAGKTQGSLIGQILAVDPPLVNALQPGIPASLARVVQSCLQKDRDERLQSAHDLKLQLQAIEAEPPPESMARSRRTEVFGIASAAVLGVLLLGVIWLRIGAKSPPGDITRFEVNLSPLHIVRTASGSRLTISPDGRLMVMVLQGGDGRTQLYARKLDSLDLTPVAGTEGIAEPFFSPDGQWIGFSATGKLKKVPVMGGLPVTICDLPTSNGQGTWGDNGTIIVDIGGALALVPADGGSPAAIDFTKHQGYRWPTYLPGSRSLLAVKRRDERFDIDVIELDSKRAQNVIRDGSWPRYLPSGHILYAQYGSGSVSPGFTGGLLVVPFDLGKLKRSGSPAPVLQDVKVGSAGAGFFDISRSGTMAYVIGKSEESDPEDLVWSDSSGKVTPVGAPPHHFHDLSLSPDGSHVLFTVLDGGPDIYTYDLARNTLQRLTFDKHSQSPVFSADGKSVIYETSAGPPYAVWSKSIDGSGEASRIMSSDVLGTPYSSSPDGNLLAYVVAHPETVFDIYLASLHGEPNPHPFLNTTANETMPVFSPDGKFIAYMSNESGERQIYVQSFPAGGGKWQVSTSDSSRPQWSKDGKKLYFVASGDRLMVVDVTTSKGFTSSTPHVLFEAADFGHANYSVTRDGRILWARPETSSERESSVRVIENFPVEVLHHASAQ